VSIVLELSPELESNIQRGHPPALAWFAGLFNLKHYRPVPGLMAVEPYVR
jgi:hypothetical protein